MRFVGKSENGKKCSSDENESRLLAKIKMAFTERSRFKLPNRISSRDSHRRLPDAHTRFDLSESKL
jgi:hypothetical protein